MTADRLPPMRPKGDEMVDDTPLEPLIAKAHEMSHRRVIWTRDADRFVAEAQPILAALADALERIHRRYRAR